MKIAIVILNYNSSDDCRKCIGFLQRQEGIDTEIVVVDNCSRSDDRNAVEILCAESGATFIASAENRGYNAGNNIGLRYAANKGYRYALIANPDMEFPQTDYLRRLTDALTAHSDAVVCGSTILGVRGEHQNPSKPDGNWTDSWHWVRSIFGNKNKSRTVADYLDNPLTSHYCKKVSGCCLLVDLDFMQRIDFFDEGVFLYCEEAILAKQVAQAGRKMFYTIDCSAVHRHIASEKGDPVRRFKNWCRSRLYFERRYNCRSVFSYLITAASWRLYTGMLILNANFRKR